jgi:hypothetical protein
MLGQPGVDRFYGGGGEDVIDARDGVRDESIQCAPGKPPAKAQPSVGSPPAGRALIDPFDPVPFNCGTVKHGRPVPGLGKAAHSTHHVAARVAAVRLGL